ncbi:MAG TPA: hypothetical protein VKL40_08805 [Candidatus Angelobacter sp.]|nr:hypothetical protein [Candidatus Angelobacter sp.]
MNSLRARAIFFRRIAAIALCSWTVVFLGCNENASKTASAPKANQFETGRFALQKMYPSARLWSPDAQPVNVASSSTTDSTGHDGKSSNWRAVFASRSRQKSQPFTWTGMADASRKIDHGVEDSYNPNNRSMQSWDPNFLKVDTDQAFSVAQQHGGKQLLEKDPNLGISYLLDFDPASNQLRWHVIYGGSGSSGRLTVMVDASSGEFLRKE